ncbi:hypothetical protein E4U17_006394 [Claviceps sp. LM77 group G4]|nr:hypothetical protein E4U17_006394 [Claviceps sp. LM77 group G4]KAG6066519.1 hypothetical protein E4U33_005538 [Claviceps sp. LM78 group G4]KAG6075674.1 hypothetical protein E4U16_003240 [Claviceps sp. LM84 group G4]
MICCLASVEANVLRAPERWINLALEWAELARAGVAETGDSETHAFRRDVLEKSEEEENVEAR